MIIERITNRNMEPQVKLDLAPQAQSELVSQFEAAFLQSMLQNDCIEQHFTDESKPFGGQCGSKIPHVLCKEATNTPVASKIRPEIIQPRAMQTVDDFVKSLWPYAKQAANSIGLDPKILIAQAALETGWGHFIAKDADGSSSHNLFNIKAHRDDPSVKIKTKEYITDTPVNMMASFKKYPSIEHSFNDYVSLMQGDRYKTALANSYDPKHYVEALYQAGYATDPDYANKILSIYHGDELQRVLERNNCN